MTNAIQSVRQGCMFVATLGAALFALTACGGGDAPTGQAGAEAPPPPSVTVAEVSEVPVTPSADFLGRVTAIDTVDIRARVEGFLDKRNFTEGDDVKAGDTLFVIEQEPYQIALDQRRSNWRALRPTPATPNSSSIVVSNCSATGTFRNRPSTTAGRPR